MHALMGQALEDIVVRGTDIYAFAPMEDRDRLRVKITTHDFRCSESSLVSCFSFPMGGYEFSFLHVLHILFFYMLKNISFCVLVHEQIHKMASIYRLKSASQGSGKKR